MFRPSQAVFYLKYTNVQGNADESFRYGNANSYPVAGNWGPIVAITADVEIWPGDDVNAILASHPEGTSFLLHAGVYRRLTLMPRSNQSIYGEPGAILDGESVATDGVGRARANDVTIHGLQIRNYTGTCVNWGDGGWGIRWTVEKVEASYCRVGIQIKQGGIYRGNYVHHNRQYGLRGGGESILVEGNEIAFNRTDPSSDPYDSGGTKFVNTDGMVFRGNHVHDNKGNGVWFDGWNKGALIEYNVVTGNHNVGIYHELGYSPVIRYNTANNNGQHPHEGGDDGAEIYGNTVSNNLHGIAGQMDERGNDWRSGAERKLADLHVYDNTISMNQGATGVFDYHAAQPSFAPGANIRFEGNSYVLTPSSGRFFAWIDADANAPGHQRLDVEGWQRYFPSDG